MQDKRDFGCGSVLVIWPVILLVLWIVAQAVAAVTVGHDISDAGCNWLIGISLIISILFNLWGAMRSANEKANVRLGWLGDIAMRRVEVKRKQDDAYESRLRDGHREEKNAHRMVMAALREVGRAYWGSVDKSWNVEAGRGLPNDRWEVHDNADHYWRVWLTKSGSEGWRFGVEGNGEIIYTNNTSEAELKRVLRLAVKNGPAFKSGK